MDWFQLRFQRLCAGRCCWALWLPLAMFLNVAYDGWNGKVCRRYSLCHKGRVIWEWHRE